VALVGGPPSRGFGEAGEGGINRADHGLGLSSAIAQPLTLVEQRRLSIEPWIVERPPDLFQR
jgi:hypothetical protein